MPDANDRRRDDDASPQWGEAFARLELETPPENGWRRLDQAMQARVRQAQAPRRDRRTSWLVALASAAVLALAIGAPLLKRTTPMSTPRMPEVATIGGAAQRAPDPAAREVAVIASPALPPATLGTDATASTELRLAQRALPGLERVWQPAVQADRGRAREATDRLVAALALPSSARPQAPDDALLRLQAQSRQLEALIVLARDDRVGNAAGVAMTGELDAAIARLDADLHQPDLDQPSRLALWRQRVEMLEHLAGIASTQRWLAAQGALEDTALVSVD